MVSIIVPVYNVEQYLNVCVESALKLKTHIEIILVDDGSTDNSGKICDALAESNHNVHVFHQSNQGLSAARNRGIKEASGDFVLFLDSDDFLDPSETDLMLSELKPETEALLGLYNNYYADLDLYEKEKCEGFLKFSHDTPTDDFLSVVPQDGDSCYMIACRFIVKKELITENDLFFVEGIYHEDEEWTQRLLCTVESVRICHRYFYQYRQTREGAITSAVTPKHIFDTFKIMHSTEQLLTKLPLGSKKSEYLKSRMAALFLSNTIHLNVLKDEERVSALKELTCFKDYCLNSLNGKIGTPAKILIKLFGLRVACRMLGTAYKLKVTRIVRTCLKAVYIGAFCLFFFGGR